MASGTSLSQVADDCRHCHDCPLHLNATQAVFGEGPAHAPIMLVGEQPGDEEDRRGRPFVGPAGALLEAALLAAGLSREDVYLTNAVKHFKFTERGTRRLHEKPNGRELRACRQWLLRELDLVAPRVVVALGATAAASLFGGRIRILSARGRVLPLPIDGLAAPVTSVLTIHPSAALRAPSPERRHALRAMLVADLALAAHTAVAGAAAHAVQP
jgi:DNA polymerase